MMSMPVRKLSLNLIVPLFLSVTACTGDRSDIKSGFAGHSVTDTNPEPEDTVAATPAETDTVWVYRHFRSADEAIGFMNSSLDSSAYSKGILHQMARDWLPYAEKLINSRFNCFIIADKWAMKIRVFDRFGRMEKEYGMGCAKNFGTKHKKADSRTPEGFFSVEGVYDSTDWLFTDDDGVTSPKKGQFGPRFIRLKIPTTSQIGIHGTCAPWSIGGRVSHGCMRITNENILELVDMVEPGMPVIVNPSRKDTQTNLEEGYEIPWISSSHDPRYTKPRYILKTETDSVPADTLANRTNDTDSIYNETAGESFPPAAIPSESPTCQ